jgi:protein involved in polysaccharide export with SLBB domain
LLSGAGDANMTPLMVSDNTAWVLRACVVLAGLVLGACGHGRMAMPPIPVGLEPREQLGVDDVFEVRVYGEQEISGSYRVAADGTFDFPFVGRISALGMTSGDLQEVIVRRLKDQEYLRNPQVTVMVKEWNSRKIAVLGQVQKPGPVTYFPRMTIVDAIAAAGGFTGIAAKNNVTLRREQLGKVESRNYPVADITEGHSPNVVLMPGDVLVVEERLF